MFWHRRWTERAGRASSVRSQALAGAQRSSCKTHSHPDRSACFGLREPGVLPASAAGCRVPCSQVAGADDLRCLLEALAWCPRLRVLHVSTIDIDEEEDEPEMHVPEPFLVSGCAPAFAKLRSLEMLALSFKALPVALADVVGALVPLTGLAELKLGLFPHRSPVVPAALGQLKGLQVLELRGLSGCVFEAGCLDLPNLLSLDFRHCFFEGAEVLAGVSALLSLTRIDFSDGFYGVSPRFFDPQLARLPRLQHLGYGTFKRCRGGACPWLCRLPADLGSLSTGLLHVDFSGHRLTEFPLALTQLVALKCLWASGNEFAGLPAGITALARLTALRLECGMPPARLPVKRLDVRALGDLSGFPALCNLSFSFCEVLFCESLLSAEQPPSLTSLFLGSAHPAPECALMVLQLGHALKRLGRGNMLKCDCCDEWASSRSHNVYEQAAFRRFQAAFQAFGL